MSVVEKVAPEREATIWERPLWAAIPIDREKVLYAAIFVAAAVSRLWMLGARVMSHDESLHTEYSWYLYVGRGFQHSPLMHGTFKFHLMALSYWLFGDNDASARLPAALFGIALIMFPLLLRRWLGRTGALATSFLLLISPSILYYARYTRDEPYMLVWAALILWSFLRYEQTKQARWLYVLAATVSLMFTTMEAAFIYTGIFALFLVLRFVVQIWSADWTYEENRTPFRFAVLATLLLGLVTGVVFLRSGGMAGGFSFRLTLLLILMIAAILAAAVLVLLGLRGEAPPGTWEEWPEPLASLAQTVLEMREGTRRYASLELILVLGTLTLPQSSALIVKRLGFDPLDYSNAGIQHSAMVVVPLLLLTILIGLAWDWRRWLTAAGIFYAIFITLFTTIFTNPQGVASGLMGSLGYWMVQQGVKRGDQPWYYYLIVMPLYEFLPLLLALAAIIYYAVRRWAARNQHRLVEWADGAIGSDYFVLFCAWWLFMSFVLYSYAGEKMPWLMVHIALPAVFLGGWALGQFISSVDWRSLWQRGGWAVGLLAILIAFALPALQATPFGGQQLQQLTSTAQWLSAVLVIGGSLVGLYLYWKRLGARNIVRILAAVAIAGLALVTVRTAWRASYINYDNTKEFLVYAHGAPAVKQVMDQVEEISLRTTDGLGLKVAFDDDSSWPFTWYLRNYPNQRFFGASASSEVTKYPVVIVGDKNWSKFDPYLRDNYYKFDYIFLWWPIEDYKNLTWDRIRFALTDPTMRAAVWDIFFNRDFTKYAAATKETLTLDQWPLRHMFRLYVDKKVAATLWNLTAGPVEPLKPPEDPHAKTRRDLTPVKVWGAQGTGEGQFNHPRAIAIAPDGSIYVADTMNHRIEKFDAEGKFLLAWGSRSPAQPQDQPPAPAPEGTFNEPWGLAVDNQGNVYVADTWNHRIQKFTGDGKFLLEWGTFGTPGPENPTQGPGQFWGPRGVAIGPDDNVYVTDTGNKRVQVFTPEGQFVAAFGGGGPLDGQLDEPVGIAVAPDGTIYVADVWNDRVQVFNKDRTYLRQWKVEQGWVDTSGENQGINNKPHLALDSAGRVYVTDPEQLRVIVYKNDGTEVANFGNPDYFARPTGIAVDKKGNIYVTDADNSKVLKFAPIQ